MPSASSPPGNTHSARLLISFAIALALHAALIIGFPLGTIPPAASPPLSIAVNLKPAGSTGRPTPFAPLEA
ncbi:MAG: hypothetical protein ACPGUC_07235, partial [Gammaproteobacteria bacterium]